MNDDDDLLTARDLIAALRGGYPDKCDFCGKVTAPENLEPEESQAWVCHECLKRWEAQDDKSNNE